MPASALKERIEDSLSLPVVPWRFSRRLIAWYRRSRDRHFSREGFYVFGVGTFVALMALDVQGTRVYLLWSVFFGLFFASLLMKALYRFPVVLRRNEMPRTASVDTTLYYSVEIRNESSSVLDGLVVREEDLPRFVRHRHHRGLVAPVGPLEAGARRSVTIGLEFRRRGVYDLETLRVEKYCPLGLMRSGRSFHDHARVVVYPKWYRIGEVELPSADMHQPGGIPMASSVGESTEFLGLREYRPGDQVKHISWKAWARLGEPAVREFQSEYFKRVALVLDTRCRQTDRALEDFEHSVSVCASLAQYFERNEYVVDLFAAGSRLFYLQAGRGLASLDSILEILAMVESSSRECFPRIDRGLRELFGRLSGLVLVSTDWNDRHVRFHDELAGYVPCFKPVVVCRDGTSRDPLLDVARPELAAVVDPSKIEEGLVRL